MKADTKTLSLQCSWANSVGMPMMVREGAFKIDEESVNRLYVSHFSPSPTQLLYTINTSLTRCKEDKIRKWSATDGET